MDKRFLAILGAIVVIFIGIVAFSGHGSNSNKSSSSAGAQPTNHVTGQGQKGVTLLEYGDFQCPVCGRFEPVLDQVRQKYAADIYFQFRNLPLVSVHPNAFSAARAAEAAAKQNKYWQMHDSLYANQDSWSGSSNPLTIFKSYAKQLGLNVDKFAADYASSEVNDAINADSAAFAKTGQETATPTFYLDGKYVNNADLIDPQTGVSLEKFSAIIDAEIAKKNPK